MSVCKINDHGFEVEKIQTLLNSQRSTASKLRIDGRFGNRTEEAVKSFQKAKGLTPDGVVGPKTRNALGLQTMASAVPVVSGNAAWMKFAVSELGIHENSLPGKHNDRIVEYHQATSLRATTDETPWCSSFVNWVMTQAGFRGTNSALAKSWLNWGTQTQMPTYGTITVIKKKSAGADQSTGSATGFHVGFFVSGSSASVKLLGGNQGDQVKYSNFSLSSYEVKGYLNPR